MFPNPLSLQLQFQIQEGSFDYEKELSIDCCFRRRSRISNPCSSQGTTTATTAAQTTAAETTAAKETAEVKETANVKETADAKETADKKETADAKETTEKADEEKESTMTGTISDIKDFMFTITSDGNDYAFTFDNDKKPEGLAEVKMAIRSLPTYTGTSAPLMLSPELLYL